LSSEYPAACGGDPLFASDSGFNLSQAIELGKACSYLKQGDLKSGMPIISQVLGFLEDFPEKIFNQRPDEVELNSQNFEIVAQIRKLKTKYLEIQSLRIQKLAQPSNQNINLFETGFRDFVKWIEDNFLDFTKMEYTNL